MAAPIIAQTEILLYKNLQTAQSRLPAIGGEGIFAKVLNQHLTKKGSEVTSVMQDNITDTL